MPPGAALLHPHTTPRVLATGAFGMCSDGLAARYGDRHPSGPSPPETAAHADDDGCQEGSAMAAIRCTCTTVLVPHCEGDCDWLLCTNDGCTARIYDVHRGLLMREDRSVVGWSEA